MNIFKFIETYTNIKLHLYQKELLRKMEQKYVSSYK